MDDFEITDDAKAEWPTMVDQVSNAAFTQANEFVALGQSPSEAGSMTAHAFIIAAWHVAAAGKIADGGTPDPDKFRDAVEKSLSVFGNYEESE